MGYVHILRDFYSYPEQATRTLRIYTPDAYDGEPERRFPVLYMCDGQNIFDHPESALFHTWRANLAMEQGVSAGAHPPWIIVGLDHLPGRFEEYSPWPFPVRGVEPRGAQFQSKIFIVPGTGSSQSQDCDIFDGNWAHGIQAGWFELSRHDFSNTLTNNP